jgi:thioredoxin-like negative regulator of GroEL
MSGLLFLTSDDFYVQNGSSGKVLRTSIRGFSLILFYSTQCQYCQSLIPIFKKLPGTIGGCQFGMINVSQNRQVVMMSKETISPITYVPYIVLFIDSVPFMRYNGPSDAGEIRRFVFEISQKVQSKQKFFGEADKVKPGANNKGRKGIPEYTIGFPKQEDMVCYLDFNEAYVPKK